MEGRLIETDKQNDRERRQGKYEKWKKNKNKDLGNKKLILYQQTGWQLTVITYPPPVIMRFFYAPLFS